MSDIVRRFTHEKFGTLRWVTQGGVDHCLLVDAALMLGYLRKDGTANISAAKRLLRDSQLNTPNRRVRAELGMSAGRAPKLITESGLWRLIMRSNKPEAEEIQIWVEDEVLPSIRRDGGYISPDASAAQRDRLFVKINYLEVTDLLTGARDYDSVSRPVRIQFGKMRNAFHYAITGMTANELITSGRPVVSRRSERDKPRGLDYLTAEEMRLEGALGRIVVGQLQLQLEQQKEYTVA